MKNNHLNRRTLFIIKSIIVLMFLAVVGTMVYARFNGQPVIISRYR